MDRRARVRKRRRRRGIRAQGYRRRTIGSWLLYLEACESVEFAGLVGSGMEIGNRDGKEREGWKVEEVEVLCIWNCDQHRAKDSTLIGEDGSNISKDFHNSTLPVWQTVISLPID